jgi:hypothetical protein
LCVFADNALHRKVLVLLAHLSEPQNAHVAQALADRAHSQQQQQQAACHASNAHGAAAAAAAVRSGNAADNLAGLAKCTERLLKLLCPAMLGDNRLQIGDTLSKGMFSEVHKAKVSADLCCLDTRAQRHGDTA